MMKNVCNVLFILLTMVMISSCDGGSTESALDGGDSSGPDSGPDENAAAPSIFIDGLGLSGSLDEVATVTVNNQADTDKQVDKDFSVMIDMGTHQVPRDAALGKNESGRLFMQARDAAGNQSGFDVDVTVHH